MTTTPLLTIAEVAGRLNVSRTTVRAWAKDIGYAKLGGSIRFRPEDVENFIRDRMVRRQEQPRRPVRPQSPAGLRHLRV